MASATKIANPKFYKIPELAQETVTLRLDQDEAATIAAILGHIGGIPETSGRKHTEAVSKALREVGYTYINSPYNKSITNGLSFTDGPTTFA